jgi:hypothetical protein
MTESTSPAPGSSGEERDELVRSIRPVGKGDYVVRDRDCLASIADAHGFIWETLWELPENAELREARRDPYVLLPGDRVTIPPLRPTRHDCHTAARHTFRVRSRPEKLRVQLTAEGKGPRRDLPYTLEVAGRTITGVTDAQGRLEAWVPTGAREARLIIGDPALRERDPDNRWHNAEAYIVEIGELRPVDSFQGAADRLAALGFMDPGDDLGATLVAFQTFHKLAPTGELDDNTQAKLFELYGS